MAVLKLRFIPDPCLRKESVPVTTWDDKLQILIDDMFETMYVEKGVGLAAPQIGINLRLTVIDVVGDKTQQYVFINPEITEQEGLEKKSEGCLSVPGTMDEYVPRALRVKVKALDRHGKPFELAADGLLAHCLQHEIDHLDGVLYIDKLSLLKRKRHEKKTANFLKREE